MGKLNAKMGKLNIERRKRINTFSQKNKSQLCEKLAFIFLIRLKIVLKMSIYCIPIN
jgi:hypothetical protein